MSETTRRKPAMKQERIFMKDGIKEETCAANFWDPLTFGPSVLISLLTTPMSLRNLSFRLQERCPWLLTSSHGSWLQATETNFGIVSAERGLLQGDQTAHGITEKWGGRLSTAELTTTHKFLLQSFLGSTWHWPLVVEFAPACAPRKFLQPLLPQTPTPCLHPLSRVPNSSLRVCVHACGW